MALSNLGALKLSLGEPERAEECFEEAISVQESCGNRKSAGIAMLNLAALKNRSGSTEESRRLTEKALENFRDTCFKTGEASADLNLALILEQEGRAPEAIALLRRSVELNRETGYMIGLRDSLSVLGRLLGGTNRGEAIQVLQEALELCDGPAAAQIRLDVLVTLSETMIGSKLIPDALHMFSDAVELLRESSEPSEDGLLERLGSIRGALSDAGVPPEEIPGLS
jgi:tetratricopeptide (TPR) repeat protein